MRLILAGFAMFILLSVTGCKKDGGSSNYYLQADINGVSETFNSDAFAQDVYGDITSSLNISGKNNAAQHRLYISIQHMFSKTVTPGTYDKNSLDSLFIPGMSLIKKDTMVYGSGVRPENPFPLSVTISAITDNTATGTFNGTVYYFNNPVDSIVITNGKFYVPIKH